VGYGWASIAWVGTYARGDYGALKAAHYSHDATFLVDLPNGSYTVSADLGGHVTVTDRVSIWAEGKLVASDVNAPSMAVVSPQFQVDITDGRLDLRLIDDWGSDPYFRIMDLKITPTTPLPEMVASVGFDRVVDESRPLTFWASAKGGVSPRYTWDFGDGTTASGTLTPSHVYADDGVYPVTLTVTDLFGRQVRSTLRTTVRNVAPTVTMQEPEMGYAGWAILLAATAADPSPVDSARGFSYTWDFGDGSIGSDPSTSHVYDTGGTFPVTLTVRDKDGGAQVVRKTVQVRDEGLANVGLSTGWATFGQALPQGVAQGALQIGDLVTQTDVKTTWPDGSIRYAIVSANVPANQVYDIHPGSPPPGTTVPTNPDVQVRFKIQDGIYVASLPRELSSDTWLDGPLVTEHRYTVTPIDSEGKSHPLLRVLFDVRSYRDGAARLDVTVENVLNQPGAGTVTYDVDVLSGDRILFHHDAVQHGWTTRWREVFDLNLTEAAVRFDFRQFERAGAIPKYLPNTSPMDYSVSGPNFDILKTGGIYPSMGAPGGRPDIAPYPDWTARFLTQQRADERAFLLANADLAGSFWFHIREPEGATLPDGSPAGLGPDRLISIKQRPDWWFDGRGNPGQIPLGAFQETNAPLWVYPDHVPSLTYIPYLITGDRYYADEMKFMGAYDLLHNPGSNLYRRGDTGLIVAQIQPREAAWTLRDLADAAAYLPNADPAKAYFADVVAVNLNWLDWYAANKVNAFGVAWLLSSVSNAFTADQTSAGYIQLWQHNYLAWSIDHVNRQGFAGGTNYRNQIVGFQLRLFTSGTSGYAREYAAPYVLAIGDKVAWDNNYEGIAGYRATRIFTTLEQAFNFTYPNGAPPTPFNGYYGLDAFLSLQMAVNAGMPGAREALDWLYPQVKGYLGWRQGWNLSLNGRGF
jgi:PKD repeat protein